jgi:hypothetical protein
MEESRAVERCCVERERVIGVAAKRRRVDLLMRKGVRQHARIAPYVSLEEIESAAMHSHRGGVGEHDAVGGE